MTKIDRDALELVVVDLEQGADLTFQHIMSVFGHDFSMLLVEALLDSQDAARAISGAINRLKNSTQAEEEDFDDE